MDSSKKAIEEKLSVARVSLFAAVFLTMLKFVVAFATGSLGVLAEAAHSALDFLAAAVTFFAVKVADKPADEDHQYGHGKAENFAALVETALLLITCFWIVNEAIDRLTTQKTEIEISIVYSNQKIITEPCSYLVSNKEGEDLSSPSSPIY